MSPSFKTTTKGGAKTDWTYSARKRRKLEEDGADSKQCVITDYFVVLDNIALLVKENQHLAAIINTLTTPCTEPQQHFDEQVTPVLRSMMENVTSNILAKASKGEDTQR